MSRSFVATATVLDRILARKVEEVAARQAALPLPAMQRRAAAAAPPRDMLAALQKDTVALIAEVKRASPSKGLLTADFAPLQIATAYAQNGAAAISVLTDEDFFMGSLRYLEVVRGAVAVPVLRKDFIIDPYQVYESRAAGADALLLIAAALTDGQLAALAALTAELGMTALVEVHSESEMARALRLPARLIGINNRDLRTFEVDLETTARLARLAGDEAVLVAESGIRSAADVARMGRLGAHAVLVGESLVKAADMAGLVRQFSSQRRVPV